VDESNIKEKECMKQVTLLNNLHMKRIDLVNSNKSRHTDTSRMV
jgi:hypothetical protein